MTIDDYLPTIRMWVKRKHLEYEFPEEQFEAPDKLLLIKTIREQAQIFAQHDVQIGTTAFIQSILMGMEKYDYKHISILYT